jgi:hypothetical protein
MQAITRGFLGRLHLKRKLKTEKENQKKIVKNWSIGKIQKVARGYIAWKTTVRSYRIRQNLSRNVLRVAEKYLQNKKDVWGFLRDINDEINRVSDEKRASEAREEDWAANFVQNVVKLRQQGKMLENIGSLLHQSSGDRDESSFISSSLNSAPIKKSLTPKKSILKSDDFSSIGSSKVRFLYEFNFKTAILMQSNRK